jgi:1,4-dihydroxy-2-naphthoate octaprenyltransferase/nitroimidazol reductase NimA-like FMN-containing flavoprotein (pyridoxamine 5'-phosphate oxidase superfamily)
MSQDKEILDVLNSATEASVSTFSGEYIRSRMMHYAVTNDLTFYLASMKNDPKIIHITNNPSITLMILNKVGDASKYMDLKEFSRWGEVEVQGKASIVRDRVEREKALKLLYKRSPVVKLLMDSDKAHILDVIRVEPIIIRYKRVSDILQGKPPIVLDFTRKRVRFEEFGLIYDKLKRWYLAIRAPFLVASIPPVFLGAFLAYVETGFINLSFLFMTLLGILLAHISVNLLNDYYDHKLHTDVVNIEYVRPFSGGSRVIQLGLLTPLEVLSMSLIMLAIVVGIGIYLTIVTNILTLLVALVGVFLILSYNAPPFRFAGRGVGELLVGIGFGIIITLGSYVVQTGRLSINPILVSIPLMFLIAQILLVNEFPDYKADKETGKNTLVVIFGRASAKYIHHLFYIFTYVSIVLLIFAGFLPLYSILSLIAIPISIYGSVYVHKYFSDPFNMVPGNISAIITYMVVGFTLVISLLLMVIQSMYVLGVSVGLAVIYMIYEYLQIRSNLSAFLRLKESLGR